MLTVQFEIVIACKVKHAHLFGEECEDSSKLADADDEVTRPSVIAENASEQIDFLNYEISELKHQNDGLNEEV